MSELSTLSKIAIGSAIAAASAGVVYYLFRTEVQNATAAVSVTPATSQKEKLDMKKVTVEKLLEIMEKIVDSQNVMKGIMKNITEEINSANLSFDQTYDLVEERQPKDPMEETGLSMQEFDELLDKYQEDPRILDAIARIMGPSDEDMASDDGKMLSVKELIDIHQYMLEQLNEIGADVKKGKTVVDPRTLTVAAQVLVGARVESKFKVSSPAVERSVMMHQNQLATNHQFATINMMMQQAMTELMGAEQILSRE